MENLEIFESFSNERTVTLTSRQNRTILITVLGGRITAIENNSGVNFPYRVGESYMRNIETWCCNNGFKMDGKDMCPEEKIFGVKVSQVPQGHEWRRIFPHKFRLK